MASSGTIKSWVLNTGTLNGNSCAGAYYSFEWTSSVKSAGVTTVSWKLYGRGRTSSPTLLENEIYLDVVINGTTTRLYTLPDSNGTAETSFNNYLRTSGSFNVTHASDGSGSFTINMKVDIYTGSYHSTSNTATLDANYHNYTVSYNANGGSGAPSAQTKVHGTALTLSSTKPTKSSTVTYPTGTITITYNANGGSSTPSAGTGTYTNTRTVPYTFSNWNTNSSGTGTSYNAGARYTANASVTLYAIYSAGSATETRKTNPSITTAASISRSNASVTGYTVSFNSNGSTATAPSSLTSTKTRKYTFGGWNTNTSGTGTNYSASAAYTFSASDTLYAKWTSSDTNNAITLPSAITRANASAGSYTVTYDANGGSCSTESASAARTTSYTFAGWNTNSSGTGSNYSAGSSYTPSSATTLYAKWNSSTTTAAVTLPTPTRTGYTFQGWQVDVTDVKINSLYIDHEDNQTLVVDSVIPDFYIYDDEVRDDYRLVDKFVVYDYQINADGITVPVIFKTVVSDEYKDPYLPDVAEPFFWVGRVTYDGSEYDCWEKIDDELGGGRVYAYTNVIVDVETDGSILASGTAYTPTGDVTLRATWEKLQYTITYDANGGTESTVPANQQKTHGVDLTLSQEIPEHTNSTRTLTINLDSNSGDLSVSELNCSATYQHDFLHWSTSDDLVDANFYFPGESYQEDASATLYAIWDCEYHSGNAITLPTPTRSGYSFKGWQEQEGITIDWEFIADSGHLVLGSVTPVCYTVTGDDGTLQEYRNSDEFIGFSYGVNNVGSTVPIIYKSNIPSVPDYANGFYYVGKVTVDGVVYDRWRKISFDDDTYSWDSTRSIYVDTNVIVNDNHLITGSVLPRCSTTLTAIWEENRLTVNFYKDGSLWCGSGKKISLLQDGHVVEEKYPSSSGYQVHFSGFDSGTYTVRVEGFDSEIDYRTVTISGLYVLALYFYTVECNSGVGIASTSGSGIYLKDEVASISATVQTGYTWNTWSDSNTDCSRTISVTRKQTLTATATANTYTIQYLSTYGTGSTASSSHTYDSSKALTSNGFSRTGYTFQGWSTLSDATTAMYTNGQSVKNLSSTNGATVTLYAVWQLSATWDPELVLAGTSTTATTHPFGTKFELKFNTSPNGTFRNYRVIWKIGTTSVRSEYVSGTIEKEENVTIEESLLSSVSTMSSSYSCYVTVLAVDESGATALTSTINFTLTVTASAKPILSIATELVDLTGICPGKELGRYTQVIIKPTVDLKYGAGLTNITITDPEGIKVVNSGTLADYTTVTLDLDNFSGYYDESDPQLTWTVSVSDQRSQTDTQTVTIPVTHHIPADVYAYVPYIWSGSEWVKYTPEIASSGSISSSDIYVPFIKG